jgi:hypothetical protein
MRRFRQKSPFRIEAPRVIAAKFSGKCHCCGAAISAGEIVTYYPDKKVIEHLGKHGDNSAKCFSVLKRQHEERDAGFVDIDRAYEDQCAEICGR